MSTSGQEPRSDGDARREAGSALLSLLRRPIDQRDLQANGQRAASRVATETASSQAVIIFSLGEELFALPAAGLRRAEEAVPVRPIPHRRSGHLRGLCAVRGEIALSADLRAVLDVPPARASASAGPDAARRTLVLGEVGRSWAVEVDSLIGVHTVAAGEVRPAPLTAATGPSAFVDGLLDLDHGGQRRVVSLLDLERLQAAMDRGLT